MVTITGVTPGSPAARCGVLAGDGLAAIDGHAIHDVLDYMFYAAERQVTLSLERGGESLSVRVRKGEYDDLGLEFSSFLMDEKQSCRNRCVFCFIDQMPPGMRETLYFKDDDARLSFLQGNYVTLTNLQDEDIARMIQMKLNVNVSVHTTNPALRCEMMHNRFAGEKLAYLKQMAEGGLRLNCQIVLCPGLNDGPELERSLRDLAALMPQVDSVAVVPVGLTKFREGLYPLRGFDAQTAGAALDLIAGVQADMLEAYDTRLVFPSDEFFLLAGRPLPDAAYYEGYPQYENGVGMLRSLIDEFTDALETADAPSGARTVSIATGKLAYPVIRMLTEQAMEQYPGLQCHVYCIENRFFGPSITVTGLLTGQDLLAQLQGQKLGEVLLLSASMCKRDEAIFLDDMTAEALSEALQVPIQLTDNDGFALLDAILGAENPA